ncbi:MAG: LysM peptidoglycan-binding domain-containing protein [Rickettsiales bacterium]|jgi:nucleoid-associated protein YgaU|nr:LysM peptidoglycan-binding domain-containing protein [Rickettsiales bacterium]
MPKKSNAADLGAVKRDTNHIIDEALDRQMHWRHVSRANGIKSATTRRKVVPAAARVVAARIEKAQSRGVLASYWFPILCAIVIVLLLLWSLFGRTVSNLFAPTPGANTNQIEIIEAAVIPSFDIVRIEPAGNILVAGRWLPGKNISISINKKIVATELANANGEFVYAPSKKLAPGNYEVRLVGDVPADESVFVYVAETPARSLSLLFDKNGSHLMQYPDVADGDLVVQKVDYLESGRIVVSGRALPRLRVSLSLDGKELGFARVSDFKNFGLGADVEKLTPGREYTISVKLHDTDNNAAAEFKHRFTMPNPTGADDTYYSVRRGDCLWIIARNFLRRGVLFSMIVDANDIKNPNLIYPKQNLKIPVK